MPSVKKYGKIRIQRNNWENFQISHRRAAVGVINGARELLVGTEEQPGLLQMAARMIRSGDFYGNPKSQTCTEKYCPVFHGCRWRR